MTNILLKSGEDTNSAQEEFNAIKESSRKDKNKKKENMNMENLENNSKKLYIVAILCLLIGFGVGYLVFSDRVPSSDDVITDGVDSEMPADGRTDVDETIVKVTPVVVSDVELTVSDQNFGEIVVVDSLALDRTSWVVVYEDNEGKPGSILGAGLFEAGTISNVEVTLLRSTTPASMYYVKIHADDGDRQFDFKKDVAVVDEDGKELVTVFNTTSGTPN